MKRLVLIFLAVLIVAGARAETYFVRMLNGPFRFDPANLTVNVGDTVIWTNRTTTPHDTVCEGVWASPLFGFRGSFAYTFNTGGTFNYVCTPHIDAGMVGTITVLGGQQNAAPTAAITSPANGASFSTTDTFTVRVNATDDARVASVRLFIDIDLFLDDASPPYEFTITGLSPGPHTFRARATDEQGATGVSETITVSLVAPNQPPSVEITSPAAGGTFTAPVVLNIEANATDDSGVQSVDFFINDVLAGTDSTAPFLFAQTFTAGTYRLRARAKDGPGLSADSAEVTIVVNNPPPSAPTVQITYPTPDLYIEYTTNMTINLFADASDADGFVSKVEFFEGADSLGIASFFPPPGDPPEPWPPETLPSLPTFGYTLQWPATEGRHTITAKATDNMGTVTTSNPISFTVALRPLLTSTKLVETNGAVRISIFGTSGVPFIFEHSEDGGLSWTPFLTNQLYRRILFFDDVTAGGRTNRMYRARNP